MHSLLRDWANPEPAQTDEQRLIAEVLAKDRKATAEFVACCADCIYPFVRRRLLPNTQSVEDLVQDILLAAWQSLSNFRGDGGLRAWFLGIARHKVEEHYRKRLRETEITDDEDETVIAVMPAFEEHLDGEAQQRKVQAVLMRLPEPYRLALLWRYKDERSAKEMAQLTGKTEKGIERLLARAREAFRKRWSDVER